MFTYNFGIIVKLKKLVSLIYMVSALILMVGFSLTPICIADSGFYDRTITTVDRNGNFNQITLDYSADMNTNAGFNEIFLSDVYLDQFDGKAVATFVFRVQKTRNEIVRGVGAYVKASPRVALPDYIAQRGSFEGYVYAIEKTNPNIYMVRFPMRRIHDSLEYDLHIDELAYYVDIQQAPYGQGMIKRLWVKNGWRNFHHEDIFTGNLEQWNSSVTLSGTNREIYSLRPDGAIFNAARKYYGCVGLFQ